MAATTALPMYRLPMYYEHSDPIPLPTCMYSLPSYFQQASKTEVLSSGECLSSANLNTLQVRQKNILRELSELKAAVEEMASTLGVSLPCLKSKTIASTQDFVISASPSNPPLLVCTLQHIMKYRGLPHSTLSYVHSSVKNALPYNVKECFQNFLGPNKQTGRPAVVVTILWKEAEDLPCLIASSCCHTPLVGELTIARFLCRTLLPDLYGNLTPDESASVDQWIEMCAASSKEIAAVKKILSTKLSSQEWALGSKMTLADVVLARTVVKGNGAKSIPDHMKRWLKKIPGLIKI